MKGKIGGIIVAIVIALGIIFWGTGKLRGAVDVGYEGVIYNMKGGIEDETFKPGWNYLAPNKKMKTFTVANEQLILTKDERDGSETDESFKVATADNASISISFQMSYRFIPENVVDTYKRFRGMSGEDIVNNRVRTVLKSKISEVTTNYTMMDIYSGNRNEINNKIKEYLSDNFLTSFGMEVLDASIIDVHPDKKLKEAIDNRVKALQEKQQAEAEQEKVKVEAETKLIKAENEAKVKITQANAEAEANKILSESISDNLIKMKEAEARYVHGWITVNGSDTVVTDATGE